VSREHDYDYQMRIKPKARRSHDGDLPGDECQALGLRGCIVSTWSVCHGVWMAPKIIQAPAAFEKCLRSPATDFVDHAGRNPGYKILEGATSSESFGSSVQKQCPEMQ
jgi:hypothetical protein